MLMRALALSAVIGACGGPKPVDQSPARPAPPDAAAQATATADAAVAAVVPAPPPPKPFSRDDLPVWTPLDDKNGWSRGPVEVFAADVDGDQLLRVLTPSVNYAHKTTGMRLTGRLSASEKQDAFSTVAKLLGDVNVTYVQPESKGGGAVDIDFVGAPLADLMRLLGDVGNVNVVLAPGPHAPLNVRFKMVGWEKAIRVLADRSGLSVVRLARMFYLVPAGTKPPAPNPTLKGPTLDVDAKDATLAQVVTGVRALGKLEPGSCSATKLTLRLRRTTPAETVKALSVASGEALVDKTECPSRSIGDEPVEELRLVAIVSAGTKRVAVFDHKGATLIGKVDKKRITDIGSGFVTFEAERSVQLHTYSSSSEMTEGDWVRTLQRTSALVRRTLVDGNTVWKAVVETKNGPSVLQKGDRPGRWLGPPLTERPEPAIIVDVREDGVHILRIEDDTEIRALPLSPK
jgi:hypothetical protein